MRGLESLGWIAARARRGVLLALVSLLTLGAASAAGAATIADGAGAAALVPVCGTDEFDGATLDPRWSVLRPTDGGVSVADGALNLQIRSGDYIGGSASAENTVLQDAPDGGFTATAEFNISAIDENGEQAGIVLWKSEGQGANTFGKVMFIQTSSVGAGLRVMESIWTDRSAIARPISASRTAVPPLPADADVQVRVRSDGDVITAELSVDDGETWQQVGQTARYSGDLRVGVVGIRGGTGQTGGVVPFERFELECAPTVTATPANGEAPLEVDLSATGLPAGATDVSWDFGDGETAEGGAAQTHTFAQPGAYRVRLSATTAAGTLVTGSTVVNVPEAGPDDEFAGSALDPKWEVLRPRPTGLEVSGGHLRLLAYGGDMHGTNASASNVVLQEAPDGAWTATTKIDTSALTAVGDQAGMVVWRSEGPNNFAKVVFNRRPDGQYWFERSLTSNGSTSGGNAGIASPAPNEVYLRIRAAANGSVTPESSLDGETWTPVQGAFSVPGEGPLKVGLTYFSSDSMRQAAFDYFRVTSDDPGEACAAPGAPEEGFTRVWNGVDLTGWTQAGPGGFDVVDGEDGCRLVSRGGLGLLWYAQEQYDEFVLRMEWMTADATDNSGVFVRFPNTGQVHQTAIAEGHEIQIREGAAGDGENQKTGSIYNFDREDARAANAPGEWNDYEIRYEDGTYTVTLNGEVVNTWENDGEQGTSRGFIGLQNHGDADAVSFRNIRIQPLAADPGEPVNIFTTIGITGETTKANVQLRGGWSLPGEEMPPSRQVVVPPSDNEDDVPLRMPNTSGTVANLAEFRGQTLTLREQDRGVYPAVHFFGTTTDGSGRGDFLLTYSDGSTKTVNVFFPDWCAMATTANHHPAIGPLTHRHTPAGEDGARCGIFHVPATGDAGKTLVSVTLPPSTVGSGTQSRSYLMALTLETADGGFVTPDLGASPFPDDLQAPESSHTLGPAQPDGQDGWYRSPVQVSLSAVDEDDGENEASGVARTEYRIDGGEFQIYDGTPFTVSGEGRHTVEYRAVDRAGNTQSPNTVQVNIDANAPTTEGTLSPERPAASGWYDKPVQLTLRGRDGAGSGAAATEYRVGEGDWQAYSGPVTFAQPGSYAVTFRSTDVAGNAGTAGAPLTFDVDGEAPVTQARINGAAPAQNYPNAVTVALTTGDGANGSGAAATEYRLDGGTWQAYGGPFTVSGDRVHVLDYRSIDAGGNVENVKEAVFRIGVATPPGDGGGGGGGGGGGADPAPAPDAWAGIVRPSHKRATMSNLRRGRLSVGVRCLAVDDGVLRLTVSRRTARRLGLRSRTLARTRFECQEDGRVTVRLKPSRTVRRALADNRRRSFTATLVVAMAGEGGTAEDRQNVRIRGERGGR